MAFRYKVVPFIGQSRGSLSASDVAEQLEITISQQAADGWEFVQLADVNIEVQPGCLGGLLGAKVEYARLDHLIFRSESVKPLRATATAIQVDPVASTAARPQQSTGAEAKANPPTIGYQPERLPSGKIKCWNCGASNDPRQIQCYECENQLYVHQ